MTDAAMSVQPPSAAVDELKRLRKPLRNVHADTVENLGPTDKLAVWITERVGTMGFFLVILLWTAIWLSWNMLAPSGLVFDPPMGFVFWLFISNMIQLMLMPLIMIGQNIQGKHSEARAEHDLEINVKAEDEIELVLRHVERQNEMLLNQNNILLQMVRGLKLDIETLSPPELQA